MGVYSEVRLECPHCGARTYVQTKVDECREWGLHDAPLEAIAEMVERGPFECGSCYKTFRVVIPPPFIIPH